MITRACFHVSYLVLIAAAVDLIAHEQGILEQRIALARHQLKELETLKEKCDQYRTLIGTENQTAFPLGKVKPLNILCEPIPSLFAEKRDDGSDSRWIESPITTFGDVTAMQAMLPPTKQVAFVQFRNLRNEHKGTLPAAILALGNIKKNFVSLFTTEGEKLAEAEVPHEIIHFGGNPSHDDQFVAAANDTHASVFHVRFRPRRLTRKELNERRNSTEKLSQHLHITDSINCTISIEKTFELTTKSTVRTFAPVSHRQSKYFLVGDSLGNVSIFTRNGSLAASLPIGHVHEFTSAIALIAYRSSDGFGIIQPEGPSFFPCSLGIVPTSITVDASSSAKLWVSTATETHLVSIFKKNETCDIQWTFPGGYHSMFSYKEMLTGLNRDTKVLRAVNTTDMENVNTIWETIVDADIDTAIFFRRYKRSELFALIGEAGVRIYSVFIITSASSDGFGGDQFNNFRMPVLLVAVVLVFAYQYFSPRGFGGKGGGRRTRNNKADASDLYRRMAMANGGMGRRN